VSCTPRAIFLLCQIFIDPHRKFIHVESICDRVPKCLSTQYMYGWKRDTEAVALLPFKRCVSCKARPAAMVAAAAGFILKEFLISMRSRARAPIKLLRQQKAEMAAGSLSTVRAATTSRLRYRQGR